MSRERIQDGSVIEIGVRIKKWRGTYYFYVCDDHDTEKRKKRTFIIGLKAEMTKGEAKRRLRAVIEESTRQAPPEKVTLRWFWERHFLPSRVHWAPATRSAIVSTIERHILAPYGEVELRDFDKPKSDWRVRFQLHLQELAEQEYSKSTVGKVRVWLKAILDEAVASEFIGRNPASRLVLPKTRIPAALALTLCEVGALVAQFNGRDRLIVRLMVECGFRPGELFALRRDDCTHGQLRIDEKVWEGKMFDEVKTQASQGFVCVSASLQPELDFWIEGHVQDHLKAFLFASETGVSPIAPRNFLQRVLQPAAERAGLGTVNFQTLRRTCATLMQTHGNVKSTQTHMRHASPNVTIGVYQKHIPAEVKSAVGAHGAAIAEAIARSEGGLVI